MKPLNPSSNTQSSYLPTSQPTTYNTATTQLSQHQRDPVHTWMEGAESRALARVRGPVVMAAQRIGLTSRRCSQIEMVIGGLRNRLLNGGSSMQPADARWIEEKIFDLERALHEERLVLWRDLLPLAETARDAAVDSMRSTWLNELARTLGGNEAQPPSSSWRSHASSGLSDVGAIRPTPSARESHKVHSIDEVLTKSAQGRVGGERR